VREEELTHREKALMEREADLVASEQSLGRACIEHDAKWATTEAAWQEYLEKSRAHTPYEALPQS
jgi:thioesterase domain-containing protein